MITLPDPNNVGQAAVAIVQLVNAQRDMNRTYDDAHRAPPTNQVWKAAKLRLYKQAEAKRDEAKQVLDALGIPENRRTIFPAT